MTTCFIDTSAFLAVVDVNDVNHKKAAVAWKKLVEEDACLFCSDYVLVETLALIQSRFGMAAIREFIDSIIPLLSIEWINESYFTASLSSLTIAERRKLSFVDCVSFEVMRKVGIVDAFAFDKHFSEQGFNLIA